MLPTFLPKSTLPTNKLLEPATKSQREYLVNKLLKQKNIPYPELLEIVSKMFGGRKIRDIGEIRFSHQMRMIISHVERLPMREHKW